MQIGDFIGTDYDGIYYISFSCEQGIKFNFQSAYSPHFGKLHKASVILLNLI